MTVSPEDPATRFTGVAPGPPRDRPSSIAPAGFEDFYLDETPALVAFLMWQGARFADATEAAQETMVGAVRQWEQIRHPRAWVRRVASRTWGRRLADPTDPVDPSDGGPLVRPGENLTEWEERHDVIRLLGRLPLRQRQVMAWTYDGYSPTEIAAELGITAEAVRASLKLARRALADLLADDARRGAEGGAR